MACSPGKRKQPKPVRLSATAPLSPQAEERKELCIRCDKNNEGVCELIEAKYPGRAIISNGIRRPELNCPLGKWTVSPHPCDFCGRVTQEPKRCRPCQNKLKLNPSYRPKVKYSPPKEVQPIPTIRHNLAGIHSEPVETQGDWFVALTTSPRRGCTLERCIRSLVDAGWKPTVFEEPGSTKTNATTLTNPTRLGVWRNWLASAQYAIDQTDAKRILTVQDDAIFHPDSKSFVESIPWPSRNAAFLSLYTPKHYSTNRPRGINRIHTRSLWGACALVWDRDALARVISHEIALTWLGANAKSGKAVYAKRKENPSMIANSDTAIGKVCNAVGLSMWFVDPSPVYHAAIHSTISHGDNTGRRNCGRCADHSKPLIPQVMSSK